MCWKLYLSFVILILPPDQVYIIQRILIQSVQRGRTKSRRPKSTKLPFGEVRIRGLAHHCSRFPHRAWYKIVFTADTMAVVDLF